ncbi:YheT family hydrolase [Costertonia aggregata]|uniref:Alpha/beta fold hydrolase n=1 Tax=Costertonia aggregata TaxID=343403 RepID=A0A7H9AQ24_9FLAO|nr:alpha/beta fold hydrolase [Costertonia aggregata]QLG45538.1 alpha/beta fold hydrolase [Costertonia aggregata]
MPVVKSVYNPSLFLKNGHFSTIYSGLFRKVNGVAQQRERLELPDGDFLDMDWSYTDNHSKRLVILLHGLEGDAQRPYITGSAKIFNQNGFDACAVNFRGCSGEPNRLYRSYHSGATEDLDAVVQYILNERDYSEIYVKGFSLGGNLALKYLGENDNIPQQIKGAVAVSVPCDLHSSLRALLRPKNYLYAQRFKKHLLAKLRIKQRLFPKRITKNDIKRIETLKDFDDVYTSKAHGFANAMDYYTKSSCLQFLPRIQTPTLIINAENDSFLGEECYPVEEAEQNSFIYLEMPKYGGHVGFFDKQSTTYTEKRAINFIQDVL